MQSHAESSRNFIKKTVFDHLFSGVCLDQISLVVPGGFFLSASILAAKSGKCVLSPGLEQIIVENRKKYSLMIWIILGMFRLNFRLVFNSVFFIESIEYVI